jgi:hypothetical protein
MAAPRRAARRPHHRSDRVARERVAPSPRSGMGYAASTVTNAPVSGPAPGPMDVPDQSGHLNPEQFVGYPGGYSTDAGNMTGVAAIEGAAGNDGAGGTGDSSGGAPS